MQEETVQPQNEKSLEELLAEAQARLEQQPDSLEAAQKTGDISGVELTLKQLRSALEKSSVREIDPKAGERFDPHRHQAMAAVEAQADPNPIASVMQTGYN